MMTANEKHEMYKRMDARDAKIARIWERNEGLKNPVCLVYPTNSSMDAIMDAYTDYKHCMDY